ncbi:uncharacterized protein TNCV_4180301 [Trichonephila clavipes]|nr:uncharacterized protein TNCV_4180301 [Trichonephila clavipes]
MGHFLKSRIYSDVTGLPYIVQPCLLFTTPAFFVTAPSSLPFRPFSPPSLPDPFFLYRLSFDLLPGAGSGSLQRRLVEWVQNEIAVVPDFHKQILFSDEAHFWLNGYVNKQNCRIWSEANPQVSVGTPLHPEKLTVWCALWAGGILLQKL